MCWPAACRTVYIFLLNLNKGILPVHDIFTYGVEPLLAVLLTRYVFPGQHQTITVLGSSPLKTILLSSRRLPVS